MSCERRPLTYDYHPYCEVTLDVDWDALEKSPTGMTAIFYPQNGGKPVTHTTNDVFGTYVNLRSGIYNVILFNQSPPEFGTIGFRDMHTYETAEIHAVEVSSKGWYVKSDDEKVAVHPEPFAVATLEGFIVTEEMVESQMRARSQDVRVDTRSHISLVPKKIIVDGNVTVHVDGIHNLRSVRGSISGLAENFAPCSFATGSEYVTHLLEQWKVIPSEKDHTEGSIETCFTSFGMPGMLLSRASDDKYWENAILEISILLVDNKTVKDFSFNIGKHIELSEEGGDIVLNVELREIIGDGPGGEPGDDPPGAGEPPIVLPDVKPEGGSSAGFDVTVDDWGEDVDIEVIL